MTLVVELSPESVRFLEGRANLLGIAPEKVVEEIIDKARTSAQGENLMAMAEELFDERASAYEALAEGAK